ncbi:MAG TPA: hypothetical protein VIS03_01125 [Kiloniellaceae bacterium]
MGGDGLSDYEGRRLKRLLDRHGEADYELDLTGLDLAHSIASIDRMVERQRFRDVGRSVVVRIDPATPESGETLFGRLGRHLLDLKRRGLIATLAPLDPARGAGFNLALPAGKETPGTGGKPGA